MTTAQDGGKFRLLVGSQNLLHWHRGWGWLKFAFGRCRSLYRD